MLKKVYILAFFVLVSVTGISNKARELKRKEFTKAIKTRLKPRFRRRNDFECPKIACGLVNGTCNEDETLCQTFTECHNGTCLLPVEGDSCSFGFECYEKNLYCGERRKCKRYNVEGDNCTTVCYPMKGVNLICDKAEKVCKLVTPEVGGPCAHKAVCPSGYNCTATEYSDGICTIIPGIAGTPCNVSIGCDEKKLVYCSDKTGTCVGFPKEGEKCYRSKCNEGFYCNPDNTTCMLRKGFGDECNRYDYDCMEGLMCADNGKCQKENPGKGDYCDGFDFLCDDNYKCLDGVCVEKDGTCEDSSDCPNSEVSYCDDGKCRGNMSLKEGETCVIGDDDFGYILASLQCEEGLGCVPNGDGESEGTCKKIMSRKESKTCVSNAYCFADAFCGCNDKTGIMQCIPFPKSSEDIFVKYTKYKNAERACFEGSDDDSDIYDVFKCYVNEMADFYRCAIDNFYYHSAGYRCTNFTLYPIFSDGASTLRVSVFIILMAIFLFILF